MRFPVDIVSKLRSSGEKMEKGYDSVSADNGRFDIKCIETTDSTRSATLNQDLYR